MTPLTRSSGFRLAIAVTSRFNAAAFARPTGGIRCRILPRYNSSMRAYGLHPLPTSIKMILSSCSTPWRHGGRNQAGVGLVPPRLVFRLSRMMRSVGYRMPRPVRPESKSARVSASARAVGNALLLPSPETVTRAHRGMVFEDVFEKSRCLSPHIGQRGGAVNPPGWSRSTPKPILTGVVS